MNYEFYILDNWVILDNNVIYNKALDFSVRIVNLYKYLTMEKSEYVMSKQILRSGSSIGANISESISAESVVDFIHKLAIARKETDETLYWLQLLFRTDYLSEMEFDSLWQDCISLKKILTSIILSTKQRIDRNS